MLVKVYRLRIMRCLEFITNYKETSDDKADWDRLMNAIANGISSGEMTKVVSSREVEFTSEHHIMWQVSWLT